MNREQHQTLRRHYRLNAKSDTAMISGSCNNSRYNYLLCAFLMLIRIAISDDCVDVAYWEDAYGNSCDVYESNSTLCETSGGLRNSFNLGYNAQSACCRCGGGFPLEDMIWEPSMDVPLRPTKPTLNTTGEPCLDRPDWNARIGNLDATCDHFDFRPDRDLQKLSCEEFGHFKNQDGNSANDVCCICGGGYNGTLLGQTFRVTFPDDSDTIYTLYTDAMDGSRNGSAVALMKDVASSSGFGMYEMQLSTVAKEEHPKDSYAACMLDLEMGVTDICIGPFSTENVDGTKVISSKSLFVEDYLLLIPKPKQSNIELLKTPIKPFTWNAWLWVWGTCIYMGAIMSILRKPNTDDLASQNIFQRVSQVMYSTLKSCTAGDVHSNGESVPTTAEMILISGFVIFGLIVLTAYTATSAAFLVSTGSGYKSYGSLIQENNGDDKICIKAGAYDSFVANNPEAEGLLVPTNYNTSKLIEVMVNRPDECHAVVVASSSFLVDVHKTPEVCEDFKLIFTNMKDEPLLEVNVLIPLNIALDDLMEDLVQQTTMLLEEGVYERYHAEYNKRFKDGALNIEGEQSSDGTSFSRMLRGGRKGSKSAAASAAAGGGSNTGSKFIGTSCGGIDEVDLDKFQLTEMHLLMPISLSLFCTTAGLIMFSVRKAKNSTVVKTQAGNVIALTEKQEDRLLLRELKKAKPYELLGYLNEAKSIDQNDCKAAINALPDRQKMVQLAFVHLCSERKRNIDLIHELTITELCTLIEHYQRNIPVLDTLATGVDDERQSKMKRPSRRNSFQSFDDYSDDDSSISTTVANTISNTSSPNNQHKATAILLKNAMNDPENPKESLIARIFDADLQVLKRMALRCARIKQRVLQKGVGEFDIHKYLDGDDKDEDDETKSLVSYRSKQRERRDSHVQESSLRALHYMNSRRTEDRLWKPSTSAPGQASIDTGDDSNQMALRALRSMNLQNINKYGTSTLLTNQ